MMLVPTDLHDAVRHTGGQAGWADMTLPVTEPFDIELRGPDVDDARIAAFEAKLGHRLPDDYRAFLRGLNGVVPEEVLRVPLPNGKATHLQLLYGLDMPQQGMDIEYVLSILQMRDEVHYPGDALPIGADDSGNKFVLALGGEHRGAVFFQNLAALPERRLDTEWYRARQFKRIADSFSDFLASAKPEE